MMIFGLKERQPLLANKPTKGIGIGFKYRGYI
jgi:hypothetical protein